MAANLPSSETKICVNARLIEGEVEVLDPSDGHFSDGHFSDGHFIVTNITNQQALTLDAHASAATQDGRAIIPPLHSLRLLDSC
jgi:hypothetical protein